jgi:hypothetical protein
VIWRAGHLGLKIAERRVAKIGTDSPRTVDAVQLAQVTGPQHRAYRNRTIDGEVIKEDGDG